MRPSSECGRASFQVSPVVVVVVVVVPKMRPVNASPRPLCGQATLQEMVSRIAAVHKCVYPAHDAAPKSR
jgi:hypothetical protein